MLPYINLPTRVNNTSQTLIDNIFISPHPFKSVSGNFVTSISDHLAQFVILNRVISNYTENDKKSYKDWKNFDSIRFKSDFNSIDWTETLNLNGNDPNYSFDIFFEKLSILLDQCTPTRKLSKKQIKSTGKPWITKGIRKSIIKRDILLNKFIKCKNPNLKSEEVSIDLRR